MVINIFRRLSSLASVSPVLDVREKEDNQSSLPTPVHSPTISWLNACSTKPELSGSILPAATSNPATQPASSMPSSSRIRTVAIPSSRMDWSTPNVVFIQLAHWISVGFSIGIGLNWFSKSASEL